MLSGFIRLTPKNSYRLKTKHEKSVNRRKLLAYKKVFARCSRIERLELTEPCYLIKQKKLMGTMGDVIVDDFYCEIPDHFDTDTA